MDIVCTVGWRCGHRMSLLNVGLHHANASAAATRYSQLVGPLLGRDANLSSSLPLVIWRETSPQHFVGGCYPSLAPEGLRSSTGADCRDCNLYNEAINGWRNATGCRYCACGLRRVLERAPSTTVTAHRILPGVREQWSQRLSSLLASSLLASPLQAESFRGGRRFEKRSSASPAVYLAQRLYHKPPHLCNGWQSSRANRTRLVEANVSTVCCSSRCRDAPRPTLHHLAPITTKSMPFHTLFMRPLNHEPD